MCLCVPGPVGELSGASRLGPADTVRDRDLFGRREISLLTRGNDPPVPEKCPLSIENAIIGGLFAGSTWWSKRFRKPCFAFSYLEEFILSSAGPAPQTPFGLIRMTVVVVPFLYVGTLISKNFAALLEEHDIFVPEDDDDDD